jgi:hypothetical protein
MKTTLEIPDAIFRRAKARAAERDIPLRQLVTEALSRELDSRPGDTKPEWLKWAGQLRHLRKETARINAIIEEEFERIEPEEWS